jgi:hypothetical protein
MTKKRIFLSSLFIITVLLISFCSFSYGFYQGCLQAIGPSENIGAALDISCNTPPATVGMMFSYVF